MEDNDIAQTATAELQGGDYCHTFSFPIHQDELARAICNVTGSNYTHITHCSCHFEYRGKEGRLFSIKPIAVTRRNPEDGVRAHVIESGKIKIDTNLLEIIDRVLEERNLSK